MSAPPLSTSSSDSGRSDTSTLVYDQEPFEQYVFRVKDLIHAIWPSVADKDITVERMKGGGFNRVIGFSIPDQDGPDQRQYVLRIPRFEAAQMTDHLASLKFVTECTDLPVPEVVAYDCTPRNVLDSPYMIQHRLRGTPIISLYPEMGHEIRCETARQLGEAVACLTSLQSSRMGKLTSSKDVLNGQAEFLVQVLDDTGPTASWPYSIASGKQDVSEALEEIFNYRSSIAMAGNPGEGFRADYMQRFARMASEMVATGYLEDVPITLCHLDFEPRNILIDLENHGSPVSGIIDWDSAVFAPSFMACTPPMWIWAWKDDEEEDERTANDTPPTKEGCELKEIFENAAGAVYMRFAYDPVYRLARRLVQFAFFGIKYAEDLTQADAILQEWSDMRTNMS